MAAKKTYTDAALRKYIGHLTQEGYFTHAPKNAEIDMSLHHLNKNMTPENGATKKEILKHYRDRKKQLYSYNRKDVVTALEWTITAPAGLNEEQRMQFFDTSLNYLKETYGSENIITSFMHANEGIRDLDGNVIYGHWHMHTLLIPVVEIKKPTKSQANFKEKICNNDLCTYKHLRNWHKNFQKYCDTHLPFKANVYMGGITGGKNRSVNEIKADTKYQMEHQRVLELEKELQQLRDQLNAQHEHTWGNTSTWGNSQSWGNTNTMEEKLW